MVGGFFNKYTINRYCGCNITAVFLQHDFKTPSTGTQNTQHPIADVDLLPGGEQCVFCPYTPHRNGSTHLSRAPIRRKRQQNRRSQTLGFRFDPHPIAAIRNPSCQPDLPATQYTLPTQRRNRPFEWQSTSAREAQPRAGSPLHVVIFSRLLYSLFRAEINPYAGIITTQLEQ